MTDGHSLASPGERTLADVVLIQGSHSQVLTRKDYAKSGGRLIGIGAFGYGIYSGLQSFNVKIIPNTTAGLVIYCALVLCCFLIVELTLIVSKANQAIEAAAGTSFPSNLIIDLEKLSSDRDHARILRYREAFSRLLWLEGYVDERIKLGEFAEDAAIQIGNRAAQSAALIDDLGWSHVAKHEYASAERYINHGVAIAREDGNVYWQTKGLRHLSGIAMRQERYDEAYQRLEEARTVASQIQEGAVREEMIAGIEYGMAECAYRKNDFPNGLDHLLRSEEIRRNLGDASRLVRSHSLRGRIQLELNNVPGAKDAFRRGLTESKDVGRRDEQIINLLGLSRVAALERREAQAAAYRKEADAMLEATPIPGILEEFKP